MSRFNYENEALDDLPLTDKQRLVLSAVREYGVTKAAAESIEFNFNTYKRTLETIRKKAAKSVHDLHDASGHQFIPDGYHVKGSSSQVRNADGLITWIKTDKDKDRQRQLILEGMVALSRKLPKVEPVEENHTNYHKCLAEYPLGDPHVGMMSWKPETGQDWDITIAKKAFGAVFDRLVKTAPPCEEALIANLGDYFHADNMEGVTTRSGHHLDLDGRFSKMIEAGMFIIRRMIDSALSHHKHVTVVNVIGNHDDTSSQWLSIALQALYENEPRVTIQDSRGPFNYFEFGKNLLGYHHGHTCKMQNLPAVMAADMPEAWGRTQHRCWHTGHIHHDSMKEYPGVKCESFRTLAAKDSYATWGGYRAGQDIKCIIHDPEHGEVERHTVNLGMVKL